MAITAHVFPAFKLKLGNKSVNMTTDTFKVMLLSAYTFSNTHATMTDVLGAGTETSGTGYTAGGATLGSLTYSNSGYVTTFDAADPSWSSSSFNFAYAVVYDAQGGTNSTNYPVCMFDFGGTQSVSGSLTLTFNAAGITTDTGA